MVLAGTSLLRAEAPTRDLLTAERTALNIVCRASGIATLTRQWADALGRTGAVVRDTRKTTPGLRMLEKWAVRCGGGTNHRIGLFDGILLKENHLAAAGGVRPAVEAALRAAKPGTLLQVEVETIAQLREAIEAILVETDTVERNIVNQ